MKPRNPFRVGLEGVAIMLPIMAVVAFGSPYVGAPMWFPVLFNVVVALTFPRLWFRHRLGPRRRPTPSPSTIWVDNSEDPLDPHGDGTIRPGDPIFDNVFLPMLRGEKNAVYMRRYDGGIFEIPDQQ